MSYVFPNAIFWKLNLFPSPGEKIDRERERGILLCCAHQTVSSLWPQWNKIPPFPPFHQSKETDPASETFSLKKQKMDNVQNISHTDYRKFTFKFTLKQLLSNQQKYPSSIYNMHNPTLIIIIRVAQGENKFNQGHKPLREIINVIQHSVQVYKGEISVNY